MAAPKAATPAEELSGIVARQLQRLGTLKLDGLVVYDIQDESDRNAQPRPFPFFPLLDSAEYAERHLGELPVEKIVYRCVHRLSRADFVTWLTRRRPQRSLSVLVGAPSRNTDPSALRLSDANLLARELAPELLLGGIAIAERHATRGDEHERMIAKMERAAASSSPRRSTTPARPSRFCPTTRCCWRRSSSRPCPSCSRSRPVAR